MNQDVLKSDIKSLKELRAKMIISLDETTDKDDPTSVSYTEGLLEGIDWAIEELAGNLF